MKNKKHLVTILLFALCICMLCGCTSEQGGGHYSIESYDAESKIIVSQPLDAELSDEPSFLVKEKRYTFEGNGLMVLDVTNQSGADYSITVTGVYQDESGEVLATETQTFDGFAAGYQNYFVFDPGAPFADFSYTFEAEPYDGTAYAKGVSAVMVETYTQDTINTDKAFAGDFSKFPTLYAKFTYQNENNARLQAAFVLVLYNENDEIVACFEYTPVMEPNTPLDTDFKSWKLCQLLDGETEFPAKYDGTLRAVIGLKSVKPYNGI